MIRFVPAGRSALRPYVEWSADTDGGLGPDAIRAQLGRVGDAGTVLQRVMGAQK